MQPFSLLGVSNNCCFRFPVQCVSPLPLFLYCGVSVCECACIFDRRDMHDRFMKLYSVRAHVHHYTKLIDEATIMEVSRPWARVCVSFASSDACVHMRVCARRHRRVCWASSMITPHVRVCVCVCVCVRRLITPCVPLCECARSELCGAPCRWHRPHETTGVLATWSVIRPCVLYCTELQPSSPCVCVYQTMDTH